MSQRERWTIYPLLFFALLLGLKSQIPSCNYTGRYHELECRELHVVNRAGELCASIEGKDSGIGVVNVYGPDKTPVGKLRLPKVQLAVSADGTGGTVETRSVRGMRMVELTSNDKGGEVLVYNQDGLAKRVVLQFFPASIFRPATSLPAEANPVEDPRSAPPRPPVPPASP